MIEHRRGAIGLLTRFSSAGFLVGILVLKAIVLPSTVALISSWPPSSTLEYVHDASTPIKHPQFYQTQRNFRSNVIMISLLLKDDSTTDARPKDSSASPIQVDLKSITKLEYDEVVRVMDSNTVKLKRNGLVTFGAVQTPSGYKSNFQFPVCMTKSPSSKARQLLPAGSKIGVCMLDDSQSNKRPRAALLITNDGTLVNSELVRSGFARPVSRGREASEVMLPGLTQQLNALQREAKERGDGMYMDCAQQTNAVIASDDQFEPMEYTVQTEWGDDGGKPILFQRQGDATRPENPGDTKGCSDFDYYEDALKWFEKYAPWYGDVAKLDPDNDGIPCPGLPHTKDQSRYRMKVPSS